MASITLEPGSCTAAQRLGRHTTTSLEPGEFRVLLCFLRTLRSRLTETLFCLPWQPAMASEARHQQSGSHLGLVWKLLLTRTELTRQHEILPAIERRNCHGAARGLEAHLVKQFPKQVTQALVFRAVTRSYPKEYLIIKEIYKTLESKHILFYMPF